MRTAFEVCANLLAQSAYTRLTLNCTSSGGDSSRHFCKFGASRQVNEFAPVGANTSLCLQAHLSHLPWMASSILQFSSAI